MIAAIGRCWTVIDGRIGGQALMMSRRVRHLAPDEPSLGSGSGPRRWLSSVPVATVRAVWEARVPQNLTHSDRVVDLQTGSGPTPD